MRRTPSPVFGGGGERCSVSLGRHYNPGCTPDPEAAAHRPVNAPYLIE